MTTIKNGGTGQGADEGSSASGEMETPVWVGTDAESVEESSELDSADTTEQISRATLSVVERVVETDRIIKAAMSEKDLVKRAKILAKQQAVILPEVKTSQVAGMTVTQPLPSDRNYIAVFDGLFADDPMRPHFDSWRGRSIDWCDNILDDDVNIMPLVEALAAFGIKGVEVAKAIRLLRAWSKRERRNDLIDRVSSRIPDWDGEKRIDDYLMKLYSPQDTETNRAMAKYFWLSLYGRVMYPGCMASIILTFIGGQNAGKSYLGKLICEELIGNPDSDSVPLNLSKDYNAFLRDITGTSVIANIGEMTGFSRGDLDNIKNFTARSSDTMDFKYEHARAMPRQWIAMMDGNKYEGVQRDETGNRRFYPMFVGQLPDEDGKPAWDIEYRTDYTGFRADFWQIMAECRAWFEEYGLTGYTQFHRECIELVQAFSREEMRRDRGTIRDDELTDAIIPALREVKIDLVSKYKNCGVFITSHNLGETLKEISKNFRLNTTHLKTKMTSLGAIQVTVNNQRGYLFEGIKTAEEFDAMLSGDELKGTIEVLRGRDAAEKMRKSKSDEF